MNESKINISFFKKIKRDKYKIISCVLIEFYPFSENLVDTIIDEISWKDEKLFWEHFSKNEIFRWNELFLKKYDDKLYWSNLSRNESLPWSENFIKKYEDKIDWREISINRKIPWSLELINKYYKKWDWKHLSSNPNLPWCNRFIDNYLDKWHSSELSSNSGIYWSEKLLNEYEWSWRNLSLNKSILWTDDLIEKYNKSIDWRYFSANQDIAWSPKIIQKYKHKIGFPLINLNNSILSDNSKSILKKMLKEFELKYEKNVNVKNNISNIFEFSKYILTNRNYCDWNVNYNSSNKDLVLSNWDRNIPYELLYNLLFKDLQDNQFIEVFDFFRNSKTSNFKYQDEDIWSHLKGGDYYNDTLDLDQQDENFYT